MSEIDYNPPYFLKNSDGTELNHFQLTSGVEQNVVLNNTNLIITNFVRYNAENIISDGALDIVKQALKALENGVDENDSDAMKKVAPVLAQMSENVSSLREALDTPNLRRAFANETNTSAMKELLVSLHHRILQKAQDMNPYSRDTMFLYDLNSDVVNVVHAMDE
jgi:hypothetical protein